MTFHKAFALKYRWIFIAFLPTALSMIVGCSAIGPALDPMSEADVAQLPTLENNQMVTEVPRPTSTSTALVTTSTPIPTIIEPTETLLATVDASPTNVSATVTTTSTLAGNANTVQEIEVEQTITPTVIVTNTGVISAVNQSAVNGIPVEEIVVMPSEVKDNVRQIYARGQALGRNTSAFSKLGDSLIATPSFLTQFDTGNYNLGEYSNLQPTIDYYSGSFERYGVALRPGLHAWGVFDPLWANKDWCQPNENLLACEFRLNNPSVLLVLLGTNDAGNPPGFDHNMRKVIEYSIENGVVPVIVTKADRFEGPDNTNNNILRQIAADYLVPLWDFDLVAGTIPGRGLLEDQVHLTVFVENDYTMPEAFQTGTGVHNLTGLMALDTVRQVVSQ